MRHSAVSVALLAVLVLCSSLAVSSQVAFAAEAQPHAAVPLSHHVEQQQQQQRLAQQIEPAVAAALGGEPLVRAVSAHASLLAVDDGAASADSASETAAEKYGTILSGGVIASVTIVLVFACLLVVLVAIEMGSSIASFLEHRRMRAYRKSKGADDPAEPKYGDFRDTADNVQA